MELLVVLLIIGMAAGAVLLSVPRQETSLAAAAQQFERDVAAARDQAVAEAGLYGIEPMPGGYAIYRLVPEGWLMVRSRKLPRDLSLDLLPAQAFALPEHREEIAFGSPAEEEASEGAALMPDVLFAGDGSATPFTASFDGPERKMQLTADMFGVLREADR